MLASLGPGPLRLLLQGLCPTCHLSPALSTGSGHPCVLATPVATSVQKWPKGSCWAILLRSSDLRSHCNNDLHDVAWRTPLECQCTPKSTPFQSCDCFLPSTPRSSRVVSSQCTSQPKCTLFFSLLFVFRALPIWLSLSCFLWKYL
jgi:hypothetical protein